MATDRSDFEGQVSGIAALREPVRREIYLYVSGQPAEVSRDDVAAACGIARGLAAFHLDKLVEEGLLVTAFRRLSGRSGPGAGRPTKLYRRSGRQVSISLPPRSYELAARLFAQALDGPDDAPSGSRLGVAAREFGEAIGTVDADNDIATTEESLPAISSLLTKYGYEPYRDESGDLRMRNCPFHSLAADHRQLVCGMNLQLMDGVLSGLGTRDVAAVLDPRPNECCVVLRDSKCADEGWPS